MDARARVCTSSGTILTNLKPNLFCPLWASVSGFDVTSSCEDKRTMFGRHKPEQACVQLYLNLGGGGE